MGSLSASYGKKKAAKAGEAAAKEVERFSYEQGNRIDQIGSQASNEAANFLRPFIGQGQEANSRLLDFVKNDDMERQLAALSPQIQDQTAKRLMQNSAAGGRFLSGSMPQLLAQGLLGAQQGILGSINENRMQKAGILGQLASGGINAGQSAGNAYMQGAGIRGQGILGAAEMRNQGTSGIGQAKAAGKMAKYGAIGDMTNMAMGSVNPFSQGVNKVGSFFGFGG